MTPWTYEAAGLNLEKYAETMAGIAPMLSRTWDMKRVFPPPFPARKGGKGSGGFASLFDINPDGKYRQPIMVTCTDGVGSKLKIARLMGRFDTVGIDLVAMSVNDLICTGGEPLVFLDYIAMPSDDPELTKQLVFGISEGCLQSGCSLVGGETAILPDFYEPGDFDMAGFAAGVVEKSEIVDGTAIRPGDQLLGLPSSGVHSNGYSLVRKVVFEAAKLTVTDQVPELQATVGEVLLTPTRLYAKPIRAMLEAHRGGVTGLANITGGGLPDNLARILPPTCGASIRRASLPEAPIFRWLQGLGNIADAEMDRVFNQGVGFVIVCKPEATDAIRTQLGAFHLGEIVAGEPRVTIH
ncbi:MAG: phosphoribosylformylglycinamidine cyclo-ligase [Fimbriiglobus sp.]